MTRITLSLKRRFSMKRRRSKKFFQTSCTMDDSPADRDSITAIDAKGGVIEFKRSGYMINDEVEVPRSETHVNKNLLKDDSHTIVDESSDDDISYNNNLDQDDSPNSSNHFSQDGDLSESKDEDSCPRRRNSGSISSDNILLSEGSSDTLLPITYSSDLDDSICQKEHALSFSNQLNENESSSIESYDHIPRKHRVKSEIRWDVGTLRGDDSSRQYMGYIHRTLSGAESSELEVQETDQSSQNEYAGLTINSRRKNSFVHSINSSNQVYLSESDDESEVEQMLDVSLEKKSITKQNKCASLSSDFSRSNSEATEILVQPLLDENKNISDDNVVKKLSEFTTVVQDTSLHELIAPIPQRISIWPASRRKGTSDGVSLEKESYTKQNKCASLSSDISQSNSEATEILVQPLLNENKNINEGSVVEKLSEFTMVVQVTSVHELNAPIPQRISIWPASSRERTSDGLKIKPDKIRISSNEMGAICDKVDMHSTCENDIKTGDHKLNKRSQVFDIDFAPTRTLSAKEKIRLRVFIPPRFVRTFPVRRLIAKKSQQAHELIRHVKQFSSEARRKKRTNKKKSRIIIIPSNHPYKILWDVFTVLLTFISAYTTHASIRDRRYEFTKFAIFTEAWFILDILLNFMTAHLHSDGTMICNGSAVWARYLTTWFPIDVLALVPWEGMFLTPIIERQNRRNIITKWFFRSKATVKVTRILRGRHFKIFGRVVSRTKKIGVGGRRLLTLIIKYLPKYILFYRNMKPVLVLKVLRQIHFGRKVLRSMTKPLHENDEDEGKISDDDDDLQTNEHPDDIMGEDIFENDDVSSTSNISSHMNRLRCNSDIDAKSHF